MPDELGVVQFKDFTVTTDIRFKLGDQIFDCLPVIPIATAGGLAAMGEDLKTADVAEKLEKMITFFEAVMVEESAVRFRAMANDPKSMLGVKQLVDIIQWLLEVHGLRPTAASSDSSTGSDETSTPSTDGALVVA